MLGKSMLSKKYGILSLECIGMCKQHTILIWNSLKFENTESTACHSPVSYAIFAGHPQLSDWLKTPNEHCPQNVVPLQKPLPT
jgi:hypothetical protein